MQFSSDGLFREGEYERREEMLKKCGTCTHDEKECKLKRTPHFIMQNRFLNYETWDATKPAFAASQLFENNSYPKFAKDSLSNRRTSYLYDLEALDNAAPKLVESIYARAKASRKIYHFARKVYRKELENQNLEEYTSFGDEVKKHWKEVLLTFGAFLDMVIGSIVIIILSEHYFLAEGANIFEHIIPILTGVTTATLFIFVLYAITLKGQETRELLDQKLISFLGIECDVILGSTIHFYFVLSLLPLFIVYFVFNWFSSPRFGLKCNPQSSPNWIKNATGIFACATDEVYDIKSTLCCKIENHMWMPFSKQT
jgi:hypothetical protein